MRKCNYSIQDLENNSKNMKIVWIITSFAGNIYKRRILRQAYRVNELKLLGIKRIFLLGVLDKKLQRKTGITQIAIEKEAESFQDIVQGNFIEAYKNLTYKHLMGLKWAVDTCGNNYSYIMKMDDDIIINLYETKILLQNKSNSNKTKQLLMGYILENMSPIRNKSSKWYVSNEEFSGNVYPTFISGWFYIVDMFTALKLIYQSKYYSKYFWIDDLFITGILREEAGIHNFVNINNYFTLDHRFLKCCMKEKKKQSKYKCDFIVGPDGGDNSLLLTFQKYSKNCYQYNCKSRPKEQLLKDTCILDDENSNLDIGLAQIKKLPLNTLF
ncbi:PREDICTED: beta-1,3-galactosyltransferase 5 [Ceratosolen solmsi marchali]|uniref:Hexosyltransferase n=1 Tax=Ceratosolen solmsi marchali TaxID=326594 RepID=A0AAJ6YWL6_9HYME|nr:PREDICTED: beta-1,3-galactosyltransferase 5 [Ceratosolen solmsi marchali]